MCTERKATGEYASVLHVCDNGEDIDLFCSDYGRPWPAVYIIFKQITHQIQVLTEPLCLAQAILYALPNNERGTKYRGLTYSARQNCPWIYRATYIQTRLRIWSVSITVVRSIETPNHQTPNHTRTPQTTPKYHKLHQTITVHVMREKKLFYDTHVLFVGVGGACPQAPSWVRHWHCAR